MLEGYFDGTATTEEEGHSKRQRLLAVQGCTRNCKASVSAATAVSGAKSGYDLDHATKKLKHWPMQYRQHSKITEPKPLASAGGFCCHHNEQPHRNGVRKVNEYGKTGLGSTATPVPRRPCQNGISPKEWCDAQGLNYVSARRYIKSPLRKAVQKFQFPKLKIKLIQIAPPPENTADGWILNPDKYGLNAVR